VVRGQRRLAGLDAQCAVSSNVAQWLGGIIAHLLGDAA
jgi:hypothetical protein